MQNAENREENRFVDPEVHNKLLMRDRIYWIEKEKIVNEKKEPILFEDHYFLEDLYLDEAETIVVRKAAQVGVSTWAILSELHDGRYWGINQIHTLPSGDDAKVFVQSKVNPIIKENKSLSVGLKKEDTDSVAQKQMGKGFMFYKGTKSETSGIMITSDVNWYDEYDRSDMQAIDTYASRQEGASSLKQKRYISTPTIPDFGIDAVWNISDQKHWRIKCPHCRAEQHMDWPRSIDFVNLRYVCLKCAGTITTETIKKGRWRAKYPARRISGYWIPQMIVPWKKPWELVEAFRKAEKEGTMDYFFNFNLGLPYLRADSRMPASLVLGNLTDKDITEVGACAGVDVQLNELYVCIGNKEAIFGLAKLADEPGKTKWERLGELMEVYDIRFMVIDATYKPNDVLEFAEKFPHRVYMNWYKESARGEEIIRFNDEGTFTSKGPETFAQEIKVLTDRERMIDKTVDNLRKGKRKYAFSQKDPNLQELITHMKTMYTRTIETKAGIKKREWANTGKNDYVHAQVYFEVAMHKKELYEKA